MGLDATVYCNCFEVGKLKEPEPFSSVSVSDDGSLDCQSEDLNVLLAFDQWLLHRACEHPNGILLHHWMGNLAQVELLRSELEREVAAFPVLLGKVVYSGTHAGDYLGFEDLPAVRAELEELERFVCSSESNQGYVDRFRGQMIELVEAAQRVAKPISF